MKLRTRLAMLAAVAVSTLAVSATAFALPPAIGGIEYQYCFPQVAGTGIGTGESPSNSYELISAPSGMTMGGQAGNYYCIVGATNHFGGAQVNINVWNFENGARGSTLLTTISEFLPTYGPKYIIDGPSSGTVGVPFSTVAPIYTDPQSDLGWSSSVVGGSLPPGLSLSGNGRISGTPTQAGTYTFTLQYTTDAVAWRDTSRPRNSFTLTINAGSGGSGGSGGGGTPTPPAAPAPILPMAIEGVAAETGIAYQPYTISLSIARGVGPVTFSLAQGALPPGIRMVPGGVTGRPTKAGTYTFTIKAVDARGTEATRAFRVTITWPQLELAPAVLAPATIGKAYRAKLWAAKGRGPYTFALKRGSVLPRGLRLSADGIISGKPTGPAKTYRITVRFTDLNGAPGEDIVILRVAKPLRLR